MEEMIYKQEEGEALPETQAVPIEIEDEPVGVTMDDIDRKLDAILDALGVRTKGGAI